MQSTSRQKFAATVAAAAAVGALALPALAASPSPSTPSGTDPGKSNEDHGDGNGNANGPGAKASHEPETPVTLHGTVSRTTDADGHTSYTLHAGQTDYVLSFGPWWFWGDRNPLDAYVGTSVTVDANREGANDEVDVSAVNGKALREPGKPPWAGGPKVVGPSHPGYKAWKAAQDKADGAASS
jgi:hypothetical protein